MVLSIFLVPPKKTENCYFTGAFNLSTYIYNQIKLKFFYFSLNSNVTSNKNPFNVLRKIPISNTKCLIPPNQFIYINASHSFKIENFDCYL